MSTETVLNRRRFLGTTASGLGVLLAGCGGGGGGDGGSGNPPSYDGWMDNVDNYDAVADRTGRGQVTIEVGAEGNGGNLAFAPPAVRIDTGTTVTWEWTGEGGQHNVVAESGASFESELTDEEGFTFQQSFGSAGTVKYYCSPHKSVGMKGVVVVE